MGGKEQFIARLDFLHENGLLDISNEPSELVAYLYHYAGRPGRSAERVHSYIPSRFNNSINGLPGNDDSGAQGSFIAFAMSGLFPVAGQNVYLISSPFFESVSYTSPLTGKVATIRCANFDPSYRQIYIQNATLDGVAYTKSWITQKLFTTGGTLELTVGPEESEWGTREEDLPPSTSSGGGGGGGAVDTGMGSTPSEEQRAAFIITILSYRLNLVRTFSSCAFHSHSCPLIRWMPRSILLSLSVKRGPSSCKPARISSAPSMTFPSAP